jgi:hypothetical protein
MFKYNDLGMTRALQASASRTLGGAAAMLATNPERMSRY